MLWFIATNTMIENLLVFFQKRGRRSVATRRSQNHIGLDLRTLFDTRKTLLAINNGP